MEALDPFYDPEEEKRAKEQSQRNRDLRSALRSREIVEDKVVEAPDDTKEFIKMAESSTGHEMTAAMTSGKIPWMPTHGYPPYDNLFLRLHQEVLDFSRWVSLNPEEQRLRESFLGRLNGVCKSLWPRSKVVPFGSFLTGLSLPSSDVDVSVIHVPVDHDDMAEIGCLRKLANQLLEEQQVSFIELRESAKVPILRIKDRVPPHCEIDICLNVEAPQATSKFILRNAVDMYPHFRPLVLLLKCFLYQRGLADTFTGGIGSYLLSCLVLGFLQQHALSSQPRMAELTSLGHLMFDFFSFYAKDFRVDRESLSVRRGGCRFAKSSRQFAAPNMSGRRSLTPTDALCVESPLEPELDIGNKVFQWKVIRSAFMQARQVLVDEIQNYNPLNAMKSLLVPNMVNPFHPMFARDFEETAELSCPLTSANHLDFKTRSDSLPPSPYSEVAVDLEPEEPEEYGSKRRRHSDEPRHHMHDNRDHRRNSFDHHHSHHNNNHGASYGHSYKRQRY